MKSNKQNQQNRLRKDSSRYHQGLRNGLLAKYSPYNLSLLYYTFHACKELKYSLEAHHNQNA